MSESDQLQKSLEGLRSDPQLRTYVAELSGLLRRERGLTPTGTFTTPYHQIVVQSLHHLANEHIRQYYSACTASIEDPAVILISYNSSVVGFGNRERRITDWIPDQLSLLPRTARVSSHVRTVIKRDWLEKASHRPNVFELHLLAQKRISISGSLPSRLPIYISAGGNSTPSGLTSGISLGSDFFILGETDEAEGGNHESPISRGIFFNLPMEQLNAQEIGTDLGTFVARLKAFQVNKANPYPDKTIPSEDLEAYASYLKSLLLYRESPDKNTPLCLCTIAISDELSNLPLGTAMVIAPQGLTYDVAIGISHICFDLFSAFYKIEQEASLLRETAFLITAWVHHETGHWSHYVSDQSDNIKTQIEELSEIAQGTQRVKSTGANRLASVAAQLSTVREDLSAIAMTATLSTELLRQLGAPSTSIIGSADFEDKVGTLLRLYSHVDTSLETKCKRKFPRAVLLVCCELIRNAAGHFSDKGTATGKIAVGLHDESGILLLSVKSEPHDAQDIRALKALNELRGHAHADLDEFMKKEDQLGGFLIHLLGEVTGGRAYWIWQQTVANRIRVEATWQWGGVALGGDDERRP